MNKLSIKFNDKLKGINVDIELDRKYTVIFGDSGTYKTMLYDLIREKNIENVLCFNYESKDSDIAESIAKRKSKENLLVVIDDADELFCMQPELMDAILLDTSNTKYLIYTRNWAFTHDSSIWAKIKADNNTLKLKYCFKND